MKEMKQYTIAEICSRLSSGKGIPASKVTPTGPYPVIGGNGVRGYTDSFNFDGECAIIGRQGANCGNVRYFQGKAYMTEHAIVAIGNENANTKYLACLFSLMHLGNLSAQSAQPGLSVQTLSKQIIYLPEISTQNQIADIIKSLDTKIELNNRINHNLEQQAQALYKSWFVDFEPFKDGEFIQSRVGLIPETWATQRICDLPLYISDYVSNGSFASLKENVTLYETPNYAQFIRNTDLKCRQFSVWVDQKSYEYLAKSKLEGGEIIISNVGDVGSVHICPQLNTPMTLGNNVIMIKPLDNIYKYFIYMTFKWFHGKDLIKGITGGSAMPKFNKTDFKSLNLLIPDYSTLCKFNSLVSNLFEITISLNSSNQRLSEIRDSLLPKLMSGELKINDLTC